MLKWMLIVGLILVAYVVVAVAATFFDRSIPTTYSEVATAEMRDASEPLKVMIWNVGYSGLGEESDFLADGGKMMLPPSRAAVEKNLAGIRAELAKQSSDIVMMQELAGPGLLDHGVDVLGQVRGTLAGYTMLFSSDIHTQLMPPPLSLRHGLGFFSSARLKSIDTERLPNEPGAMMGLMHRQYHAQVARLDVGGRPWALVNLHLSAFDEGANTRKEQLQAVFELGRKLHAEGNAVVIGGDWNMMLADTNFPHTSAESALFWLHRFPESELPEGWKVVADVSTPSVRTNERVFRRGENFTTVIDGFIVSPNIEVLSVSATNLDFRFTDHQPVRAEFRRKD